jgi:hypothetical protein
MSIVTLSATVSRVEGMLATELDGELVLMSIEHGAYFGLEKTARRIWDLLEEPQVVEALCARLSGEYNVARETCEPDILRFLEQLHAESLIVVS